MLVWVEPKLLEYEYVKDKIFICYKNGYPLTVCEWRIGHGFISIGNQLSFYPDLVAEINLP
jgi:hypothetical protein